MLQNKRLPKGGSALLLAGAAAAFAYYKYSKMTPEQKENIFGTIKDQGRKLYDQYVPEDVKEMLAGKSKSTDDTSEANSYTG